MGKMITARLPEWATKIATWAFMAVIGAGFSVYMDTAKNTQDIEFIKKTMDRHEGGISQVQTEVKLMGHSNEEKNRKALEKLDEIMTLIQQQRMKR